MRTLIRLQNHGCRRHPYWWIVIQGSYTNLRGSFVEHVGYYLPRRTATVQRAIILNKPRILYWLAVGAQPSKAVQRMLSYVDMMPKPLPSFGAKYNYEKPPKNYDQEKPEDPKNDQAKIYGSLYEEAQTKEEMNKLERELRTYGELKKQAKWNLNVEEPEMVNTNIDDPVERTQVFQKLKTQFIELEKDVNKLNTRKREMLFRKMNQLASKGLVNLQAIQAAKEESLFGTTTKERIETDAKLAKLMSIKRKQYEKLLNDYESIKRHYRDNNNDDYTNYIMQKRGLSPSVAKKEAAREYELNKLTGEYMTKHDAYLAGMDENSVPEGAEEKETPVLHTKTPITPFPDIYNFDPYSYYDTRLSHADIEDPNKAYDTFRDDPRRAKFIRSSHYRRKQNKGRKTPVRVFFSTLNKPGRTPFAVQPSLNVAYTGVR